MSSLHRRIASRLRFRDYCKTFRDSSRPAWSGSPEHTPPKHRSLARLYRELYRLLADFRFAIALSLLGLTIASLLKLVPPLATKAAIDYVIPMRPLPAWIVAWSPIALPEYAQGAVDGSGGHGLHVVSVLGKALALTSRWQATRMSKQVQVAVRRKVYEHAMRLPLHRVYQLKSGGASSLLARGCRRRRRTHLQHDI